MKNKDKLVCFWCGEEWDIDHICKNNGSPPEESCKISEDSREAQPVTPEPLYLTFYRKLLEKLKFYPVNDAYYNRLRAIARKSQEQNSSLVFHASTSPSETPPLVFSPALGCGNLESETERGVSTLSESGVDSCSPKKEFTPRSPDQKRGRGE